MRWTGEASGEGIPKTGAPEGALCPGLCSHTKNEGKITT